MFLSQFSFSVLSQDLVSFPYFRQSGQYKNAIETYLEIKPLIKPDDVTGLALSYYFDGQLEECLQCALKITNF